MNRMKLGFGWVALACVLMSACSVATDGVDAGDENDVDSSRSAFALDAPFFDFGTTCTLGGVTMHCCPKGSAMIGAHVGDNVFKCAALLSPPGSVMLNTGTVRLGMHACPLGQIMAGMHVEKNLLACESPRAGLRTEVEDTSTKDRYPMHVCPEGAAMAGIHVGNNVFLCDS